MNCKKGDLAFAIRGAAAGALVECLEFVGHYRTADGDQADDCWLLRSLCSYRFEFTSGGLIEKRLEGYGRDSSLRPLRGDLEDEKRDEEITA